MCEPEAEEEAEIFAEEKMEVRVEVEEDVTDFCVAEPATEATKEPAAEDFSSGQVSAQAETKVIPEAPKPQQCAESIGPAAWAQEGERSVEADVLVEEDKAAVWAEPVTAAEVEILFCLDFLLLSCLTCLSPVVHCGCFVKYWNTALLNPRQISSRVQ